MAWATVTFDENGGSGSGYTTLYGYSNKASYGVYNLVWWATAQSTESSYKVTSMTVPTKAGKRFAGYYYNDVTLCDCLGNLKSSSYVYFIPSSLSITSSAVWVDPFSIIKIAPNGGTVTTSALYRVNSSGVCYTTARQNRDPVSCIAIPTRQNYRFLGATIDGTYVINRDGSFTSAFRSMSITSDTTATCQWKPSTLGTVEDYFSLASENLIPESSDSGDTHQHTCAYNATTSSTSADNVVATEISGIWRNPRVTYRVIGDITLAVTLGAAFKGEITGTGSSAKPTMSGYMISAVEVHTAIGEAPTVTVSAVANEGHYWTSGGTLYSGAQPAIKTYAVSIPISPRHRPQNLLSAISGGGELQELTLVARGDPVVVAENGMPCASDMTHGRIEVTATTAAYNNESAPTAGTNFTKTAEPVAHSGTGYKTFSVAVRKELT